MKMINDEQKAIHIDETELKIDSGNNNFIFVGSSTDMFAQNVSDNWINATLNHCYDDNNKLFGGNNKYMFQSKNPKRILDFIEHPVFKDSVICTTIETNRWYPDIMNNCPKVEDRAEAMEDIALKGFETYVTVEPIMDFDLDEMVKLLERCHPKQVTFGKESFGKVKLPETSKQKFIKLLNAVKEFADVKIKDNIIKKKI